MAHAHPAQSIACAVLTASDTRTAETDTSGARIRVLLTDAGHRVVTSAIERDDPVRIGARLDEWLHTPALEAIIVNGGTGLAPRDTTFEAVAARLEKRIDGFGELFRMLSFHEIGPAAMLSRAVAGVACGKVVASLPGSTAAVELAMNRLLLPELSHMVGLVRP